jgi:hypothetical protein
MTSGVRADVVFYPVTPDGAACNTGQALVWLRVGG